MDHPASPTFLAESIVFRDINVGLTAEARVLAFERIARLVQSEPDVQRIKIDILRDDKAASEDDRFVAKGELELGGPGLLASVASPDANRSLDYLLETFQAQLRRRRSSLRAMAR